MNNNIFDTYTDEYGKEKPKLTASQMRILAMLYSLNRSIKYRVKVRQSAIAKKCGISISSVKRNIDELWRKGYILGKIRQLRDDGTLGTYTYILPEIAKTGYFYVSRKALDQLNKTQTRMYLFLCKCARSKTYDCWNSFNDIAKALKISRNSAVKCIRELVELKVIEKRHNLSRNGAFYDNTYVITSELENRLEYQFEYLIDDINIDTCSRKEANVERHSPMRKPQLPYSAKTAKEYIQHTIIHKADNRNNMHSKSFSISGTRLSRAGP